MHIQDASIYQFPTAVETIVVEVYNLTRHHTVSVAYEPSCTPAMPGNGGTRWMTYPCQESANQEAVILAKKMMAKHRLYETKFCGAKFVINGPRFHDDRDFEVLDSLSSIINKYEGRLYTGCDINTTSVDMEWIAQKTKFVLDGLTNKNINTSLITGCGVFASIQSVLAMSKCSSIPRIAIHGLGKVGSKIAKDAVNSGYYVSGYDLDQNRCIDGVTHINEDIFFGTPCDVLVLASSTGVVTEAVASKINAKWIVSAANAPISNDQSMKILHERGILYLPDIVSNSGAVIADFLEVYHPSLFKQSNQDEIDSYVSQRISAKTFSVLADSHLHGRCLNYEVQQYLLRAA